MRFEFEGKTYSTVPGMVCPLCRAAIKPGVQHRCREECGVLIFTSAEFAGVEIDAAAGTVRVAFLRRAPVQRRIA